MTDQPTPTTDPAVPAVPDVTPIVFTLPKVWTQDHWAIYSGAMQAYTSATRETGAFTNAFTSQFMGAKALVENGIVHITGVDLLSLSSTGPGVKATPLAIMAAFVRYISTSIEDSINLPLEASLKELYGFTVTVNVTRSLVG